MPEYQLWVNLRAIPRLSWVDFVAHVGSEIHGFIPKNTDSEKTPAYECRDRHRFVDQEIQSLDNSSTRILVRFWSLLMLNRKLKINIVLKLSIYTLRSMDEPLRSHFQVTSTLHPSTALPFMTPRNSVKERPASLNFPHSTGCKVSALFLFSVYSRNYYSVLFL